MFLSESDFELREFFTNLTLIYANYFVTQVHIQNALTLLDFTYSLKQRVTHKYKLLTA